MESCFAVPTRSSDWPAGWAAGAAGVATTKGVAAAAWADAAPDLSFRENMRRKTPPPPDGVVGAGPAAVAAPDAVLAAATGAAVGD